jgi:hypothetical protein
MRAAEDGDAMIRTALIILTILFLATSSAVADDYCDRYPFGSPEWWNCKANDHETGG